MCKHASYPLKQSLKTYFRVISTNLPPGLHSKHHALHKKEDFLKKYHNDFLSGSFSLNGCSLLRTELWLQQTRRGEKIQRSQSILGQQGMNLTSAFKTPHVNLSIANIYSFIQPNICGVTAVNALTTISVTARCPQSGPSVQGAPPILLQQIFARIG